MKDEKPLPVGTEVKVGNVTALVTGVTYHVVWWNGVERKDAFVAACEIEEIPQEKKVMGLQ